MKRKILNNMVHQFAAVGYFFCPLGKNELCFMNESKTIEIIYDILQRPLLRYTVGPIRRIRELRIKITIKYGEEYMFFYPKNLIDLDTDLDEVVCKDQEELEETMIEVTELLVSKGIPLLDKIASSTVCFKDDYYKLLAVDTRKQAERFAQKYNREISYSQANKDWAENWLRELKSVPFDEHGILFEKHLGEIVELAAYMGEMILSERSECIWKWVPIPERPTPKYGIFFPSTEDGYDLFYFIIAFWNFSSVLNNVDLFPYQY